MSEIVSAESIYIFLINTKVEYFFPFFFWLLFCFCFWELSWILYIFLLTCSPLCILDLNSWHYCTNAILFLFVLLTIFPGIVLCKVFILICSNLSAFPFMICCFNDLNSELFPYLGVNR